MTTCYSNFNHQMLGIVLLIWKTAVQKEWTVIQKVIVNF